MEKGFSPDPEEGTQPGSAFHVVIPASCGRGGLEVVHQRDGQVCTPGSRSHRGKA